jgi:hypothetical protein
MAALRVGDVELSCPLEMQVRWPGDSGSRGAWKYLGGMTGLEK